MEVLSDGATSLREAKKVLDVAPGVVVESVVE
jgi:hypothetical protein